MKIVTLDELRAMPDGIIFQEYEPETLKGPLTMKLCTINFSVDNKPGWSAELSLEPGLHQYELGSDKKTRWTNFATDDSCWFDYDKETLFAVYDKNELLTMINILLDGVNTLLPEDKQLPESFTNEDMDTMKSINYL